MAVKSIKIKKKISSTQTLDLLNRDRLFSMCIDLFISEIVFEFYETVMEILFPQRLMTCERIHADNILIFRDGDGASIKVVMPK